MLSGVASECIVAKLDLQSPPVAPAHHVVERSLILHPWRSWHSRTLDRQLCSRNAARMHAYARTDPAVTPGQVLTTNRSDVTSPATDL